MYVRDNTAGKVESIVKSNQIEFISDHASLIKPMCAMFGVSNGFGRLGSTAVCIRFL